MKTADLFAKCTARNDSYDSPEFPVGNGKFQFQFFGRGVQADKYLDVLLPSLNEPTSTFCFLPSILLNEAKESFASFKRIDAILSNQAVLKFREIGGGEYLAGAKFSVELIASKSEFSPVSSSVDATALHMRGAQTSSGIITAIDDLDSLMVAISTATDSNVVVNMNDLQKAAEVVVTVELGCNVPAPGTDRPRKVQRVLDVGAFTDPGEKAVARLEASVATLGTTMQTDMGTKCAAERQHLNMKIAAERQHLDTKIAAERQHLDTKIAAERHHLKTELGWLGVSVATLGTTMKNDMRTKCATERQHLDMKIAELAQQLAVLRNSLHYSYIHYILWFLTLIYLFFKK